MKRNTKFLSRADNLGLSQRKISVKTGISESRISEIVRGYTMPSHEEVMLISKILNSTPQQLGFKEVNND